MNQAEIDKIIEVGEQQGFWVRFDSNLFGENEAGFEYGQDTPCGEDWFETISADNANDFMKELEKRINDWDSDSEAMPFIEMRGQHGVPSSIKDLVDDADWKYDRLVDFLSALQNTDFEEIESVKEESKVDETITKLEEDQESLTEYMEEIASVSPLHNLIIEDISFNKKKVSSSLLKVGTFTVSENCETICSISALTSSSSCILAFCPFIIVNVLTAFSRSTTIYKRLTLFKIKLAK